jgi:NitT/TauT family transport system ATP-binding protein
MHEAVVFDGVCLTFKDGSDEIRVLDHVDVSVKQEEILGLVGPSGCGKTTMLRLAAGLVQSRNISSTSGDIRILGMNPGSAREKQAFGFLFQDSTLLPWRNVLDNALLPCDINNNRDENITKAHRLLDKSGLLEFKNSNVWDLSGGMKQRVALVRALMTSPSILILDEPFYALDEIVKYDLFDVIQQLWSSLKPSIIFVAHDLSDVVALCDRVLVLSERPARVLETVDVKLPRPRSFEHRTSQEFANSLNAVRSALESGVRGNRNVY